MSDNALSTAVEAGTTQDTAAELATATEQLKAAEQQEPKTEGEDKPKDEAPKKEKTPEEREIARLRRRVDNLTRRLYEGGQKQPQELTRSPIEHDNRATASDNETLSLSRRELQERIEQEARKLAPTIKQQSDEIEHRRAVVTSLAKTWGQEKFDALAADLNDAFDGLTDANGRPKAAADAIFESEAPADLIEYLADPEHADEAEAIGRMSAVAAARAITKLEAKLQQKKAEAKPQPSKAPAPIEPVRGAGKVNSGPSDSDPIDVWVRKERERVARMRKGQA